MRVEPYTIGSYVHVIKRGSRGLPIVKDEGDRWRFLLMLYHFNDSYKSDNWYRELMDNKIANTFQRPPNWPKRKKIVEILCFCLLDNHFHLLLKEIIPGGVSKFMQKLGNGMSKHYNEKYDSKGSIFQGAFKLKTISSDEYLRYVSAYIQVKNTFEMFPGGIQKAFEMFDKAYLWSTKYPYSSLGNYAGVFENPIVDRGLLGEVFSSAKEYKDFSNDFILGRKNVSDFDFTE